MYTQYIFEKISVSRRSLSFRRVSPLGDINSPPEPGGRRKESGRGPVMEMAYFLNYG
jgi:hypothetical protein